ncbi:MAG: hypothetical protein ACK4ND_02390 [Cytophagaceae bacterium]
MKRFFAVLWIITIFSFPLSAAEYYWVGGGGNWSDLNHWATSSGGTDKQTQLPSPDDDVFFDEHSFPDALPEYYSPLYLDIQNAQCRNMDWTNLNDHIMVLQKDQVNLEIFGTLLLSEKVFFSLDGGAIMMKGDNPNNIIRWAGRKFNSNLIFDGTETAHWTLQNDLMLQGALTFIGGTLNTNNVEVTCQHFLINSENTKTLQLTSSVLTIKESWQYSSSNLTLDAGTSLIKTRTLLNSSLDGDLHFHNVSLGDFSNISLLASEGSPIHFNNVTLASNSFIIGNSTINNLILTKGKTYTLEGDNTLNIQGELFAEGTCAELITIKTNDNQAAFIHKPEGTINLSYVTLDNIIATGGATFQATNSIATGSTSGWEMTSNLEPRDLYWVGDSGNWEEGLHWSTEPGGIGGECPPSTIDNVYFTAQSFSDENQSVEITGEAYCRNMVWDGVPPNSRLSGNANANLNIAGSVALHEHMIADFPGNIIFQADQSETIFTAGVSLHASLYFSSTGNIGSYSLTNPLHTHKKIVVTNGSFHTNDYPVSSEAFNILPEGPVNITFGTSFITLTGQGWTAENAEDLNFDAGSSTIVLTDLEASLVNINLENPLHLNKVIFENTSGTGTIHTEDAEVSFHEVSFTSDGLINGSNTFYTLSLSPSKTYILEEGQTQTIVEELLADRNSLNFIFLQSTSEEHPANIYKSEGIISVTGLSINNVTASGNAVFLAQESFGYNNTSGWIFTEPEVKNLFWVAGSGNWEDATSWSDEPGGSGGYGLPTFLDNVFFTEESFSANGQVVSINDHAFCQNMEWTDINYNVVFHLPEDKSLSIYGHFILDEQINSALNGTVIFKGEEENRIIASKGKSLTNVSFHGEGSWNITEDLHVSHTIQFLEGEIVLSDIELSCKNLLISSNDPKMFNAGSSELNISVKIA